MTDSATLFDFKSSVPLSNWYIVNDGVMGGRSDGNFSIDGKGHGRFWGDVSLENNGGFTSVRHVFERKDVTQFTKIVLKIKGDGKRYQFRVKPHRWDRHAYVQHFETTGKWQEIEIELESLSPTFRGRKLNMPNYPAKYMEEVTLMVANKKAESFELLIDEIYFR